MKKKRKQNTDDLLYQCYKDFKHKLVYCGICGQPITWLSSEQSYDQYQQEVALEVHEECYIHWAEQIKHETKR